MIRIIGKFFLTAITEKICYCLIGAADTDEEYLACLVASFARLLEIEREI